MAITSFDISCDKIPTKSSCSTNSSKGGNSCRLLKINIAADGSLSSTNTITGGKPKNNSKSPYLTGDRVQLLSRVTEKRLVHKKTTDFVSSFPLAVNIYKANSDEFKSSKKANKKVKKSVLTLPNDPVPVPQTCTVSDMNDSEYCGQTDEDRKPKVTKKRLPIQTNRKARVREKDFEFYDRDAQYCSQLNINLDSSSTDMMKNFNGDGKRISNRKKVAPTFTKPQTANNNLNDVWTVLRNMNRFQFRPSPPLSEESIVPIKKKVQKRRTNRKDTRVIETCRTEEFAYISSYGLDGKSSHCYTPSSSADRITVIDKKNEFSKICEEFEKRLLKTHNFLKDSNNNKNRTQKSKIQSRNGKNSARALGNGVTKETKQLVAAKKKKKGHSKSPIDLSSKSDPTNSNSVNRDSLGDGNSQITDTFDLMSHQTHNDSLIPTAGSFVYSDNSGSSKAELLDKNRFANDKTVSPEVFSSQSNGTSKAVMSIKGQEQNVNFNGPKKFDPQMRKPRLVTTMPSSCTMPKFTQAEIKRRLAHIRFPLLVLGRDQVSSNIPVLNYDPPQFDGLDKHIWPFMREWSDPCTRKASIAHKESKRYSTNKSINTCLSDSNSIKSQKIDTAVNKIPVFKEKITANSDLQKKHENRRTSPSLCSKKQKSIVQLKEKMLNFLYKKSSNRNFVNDRHQNEEIFARKSKTFISGNKLDPKYTQLRPGVPTDTPNKICAPITIPAIVTNKKAQHHTYPWSKAKWASDFIENVIKKIKSGVYYTQDNKDSRVATLKEVSVQAGNLCDSTDSTQTYESDIELLNEVTSSSNTSNLIIPGFNNTQPVLEIKTLNINQIAIKHCVTNVMLQFDVTVPAKLNQSTTNLSKSLPLIPIKITDSHTKVYKCNTTIFNAMLPAELCSILPKLMSNLIELNKHSDFPAALCPAKTDSCLSTISELTRSETISSIPQIIMLTEINQVLEGSFSTTTHLTKPTSKINVQVSYNNHSVTELLPKIWFKDLSQFKVNTLVFIDNTMNYKHPKLPLAESKMSLPGVTDIHNPTCTAMEVHSGRNKRLGFSFKPYNLVSVIESILSTHNLHINLNLTSYFDMLKLQYEGKNIAINVSMTNNQGVKKNVLVTVSNLKIDSLYKASPKIGNRINDLYKSDTPMKCIEYHNNSIADKSESTEINQIIGNKTKRNKGFYKLYRKCKSTTNIPSGEKCINTPLNKIANLEDFFQVLGSKKTLCSVFDGYAAKKILSSILEMRNWITEINPKQALLILLLTNKKDTPNLVRFRPILLQGIAVNRITRATELDMEIEVIERENLNKFSQYEGISYLPESITNYDNLLEELYWIAKTTASDYQKPFDESSERLLKSLLEKRKKLNPSYLRVMARYVGLGLLKSPTKT